ncbi:hypothetical protein [Synechococcus sp. MIT S9504]|uniref:hypothetical protein n=1 Tax=Synechococcus sp. MIT S9504 TaxID=1801628 RepID=UPI0007BB4D61|nr:hypothetical protein [Synechococcus sp. MIT S9504]KZR87167.1 hypothetical protein MITS9504_00583 [Synechococcus sp. MIT S9504]
MRFLPIFAGLMLCAIPASATRQVIRRNHGFSSSEIKKIEISIQRLGGRIVWKRINSGACTRQGLLGVYKPEQRTIFLCQQNIRHHSEALIETLRHEGWHAVQQICNKGLPVLSKKTVFSKLTQSDKKNLKEFYDRSQYHLEAEARAIEKTPTDAYIRDIELHCK